MDTPLKEFFRVKMKLKKTIKIILYFVIFYSGILHFFLYFFDNKKKCVIMFYHRFSEIKQKAILHRLDSNSFRKQMIHLKRWYDIITLDKLIEKIYRNERFEKKTIVITIDDGFKDNYDFAFPILKELNIPATIFLTSGLIGSQRAPWVDELGIAIEKTNQKKIFFPELFGKNTINISDSEMKSTEFHRLYLKMLYLDHNVKREYFNSLIEYLNEDNDKIPEERVMLNWAEIVEMSNNGITYGAHTMTHPTLSKMKLEEAKDEIASSRKEIEKHLKNNVKHFAIPNGKDEDFTEELRKFCKDENFKSILTTNFGIVNEKSDPYDLQRMHILGPMFMFACELAKAFFKIVR